MEINLVSIPENEGYYEYDFFPERKFDRSVHIILYGRECLANLEYFWFFHEHDKRNIKVIVYCPLVMFPIASLCSHKCRMMRTSLLQEFYSDWKSTVFRLDRKALWVKYQIPRYEVVDGNEILPCYRWGAIDQIVQERMRRPIYLDITAFQRFEKAKEMYKEGLICVETRLGSHRREQKIYWPINHKLPEFGSHVVGCDHRFQREIIQKYDGEDCYLSFQILASLFCKCAFVGISGAGSLFTITLPINAIFLWDNAENVPEMHRLARSRVNKVLYNIPTHGFPFWVDRFGYDNWATGWRWAMIEEAFASVSKITLPEVKINYL